MDTGPEWRDFGDEESQQRERAGSPLTPLLHDRGMTTSVGYSYRDASGRVMDQAERERAERLGLWQGRVRVSPPGESNLSMATRYFSRFGDHLGLPKDLVVRAAQIYREALEAGLLQGRPIKVMAAACLYAACRDSGLPRTLKEIVSKTGVSRKDIARSYRVIIRYTEKNMPVPSPIVYVSKIAAALAMKPGIEQKAIEILRKAAEMRVTAGKDPMGLAAAALYMACRRLGVAEYGQKQIARAANVTEVTVRNRFRGLREALEGRVEPGEEAQAPLVKAEGVG